MMRASPRDTQRLPQLSARRQSSQQLQLLDLAFQGHATSTADGSLEYETCEVVSTSTLLQDESALMEAADPELFHAGVEEHARRLGMDPERERDFLWLARESLVAPLPDGWFHATASESGAPYYYNEYTGESRWDHPCDDQFRQIFRELKLQQQQQQQQQQTRRYDHYGSPLPPVSAPRAALLSGSSESHLRHHHAEENASYYAASSTYQTLAWQDDPLQQGAGVDQSEYHGSTVYAEYVTHQEHQWSAEAEEQEQVQAAESADTYPEYSYEPSQSSQDQTPEYDTESAPVIPVQSSRSARNRSSSSPRNSLADAQHTERLTEQYLAQKAADEQTICDLQVQIQSLSKQLEAQEARHQTALSDRDHLENKLSDYKDRLDEYVKKCEELAEKNSTMKRELLAARNRLEEQQQEKHKQDEVAATKDHSRDSETHRLTELVSKEQSLRKEVERKHEQLMKVQSRSDKELEDLRSQVAGLQAELAALKTAERQLDARASASAADASATAVMVADLTAQLNEKQVELIAAKRSVQELEASIDELTAGHARSTESLHEELARQLAEKDSELVSQQRGATRLRGELHTAIESQAKLEKLLEEQKQLSAIQLSEAEDQNRTLKRESRAFERDLKTLQTVSKEREEELVAARRRIEALESKVAEQEKLVESAHQAGFVEAERASAEVIRQAQAEKARVAELYAQELQARRKLHNRLMELQGNIRVFCRVRPIQPVEMKSEQAAPAIFFRENDHESLELLVGTTESNGSGGSDGAKGNFIGQKHSFEFDHVFQPTSTQMQVFEQTRALVVSALDGFNVCIFAYGQTGSGKTHTMEGTESDRGVNFRALQELFSIRDDRVAAGNFECSMKLSILEVYNETIVDLLDNSSGPSSASGSQTPGGASTKGLDVRMGKAGVYVDNLIEVEVFNENDVVDLMKLGHSHRSVGAHDFNEHSSRSHLVLSIQIETVARMENRRRVSKLHLIDLAGSERVSKTAASGQRLKEAQNINRSLSALGDVIAALGASSKHVPYRNSKLTFLLQDSLSGNSKVLMFVNVSPVQWNAWETLCSLNFASRCRNVALGQAKQQSSSGSGGGASSSTSSANAALSPTLQSSGGPTSPAVRPLPRGAPPASGISKRLG